MLTTYAANKLLDHMFKGAVYVQPAAIYMSLHTATPGDTGASEVTGGSYARQNVTATYDPAAFKVKLNSNAVSWANMPAVTVTHVGIWDAATAGNPLEWASLSVSKVVASGATFVIGVGAAPMSAT
jgi:hypothetical protein